MRQLLSRCLDSCPNVQTFGVEDRCVEVVPSSLELKVQEEDTKREADFKYFDPAEFECSVSVFGH